MSMQPATLIEAGRSILQLYYDSLNIDNDEINEN